MSTFSIEDNETIVLSIVKYIEKTLKTCCQFISVIFRVLGNSLKFLRKKKSNKHTT